MTVSMDNSTYKNLIEMLDNSRKLYADRPLYGTKRDGIYEWTTYEQFAEKVDDLRGGLASLGVSSGDKVAIISKNTEEWAVSAYATYGLCGQHIPMYETQIGKGMGIHCQGLWSAKVLTCFKHNCAWNKLLIFLNGLKNAGTCSFDFRK